MIGLFVLYPGERHPKFTALREADIQTFPSLAKDTIYFFMNEEKTEAFI